MQNQLHIQFVTHLVFSKNRVSHYYYWMCNEANFDKIKWQVSFSFSNKLIFFNCKQLTPHHWHYNVLSITVKSVFDLSCEIYRSYRMKIRLRSHKKMLWFEIIQKQSILIEMSYLCWYGKVVVVVWKPHIDFTTAFRQMIWRKLTWKK